MKNEKFLICIKSQNASLYHISEKTGIPYTTLSRLKLGKMDINKCSSEVVQRIARFFGCSMESLLNPYPFMAGVHGVYKGCQYRWVAEMKDDVLYVKENGIEVEIDRNVHITDTKYREDADTFTRMAIDIYLEKKEADALCRNIS